MNVELFDRNPDLEKKSTKPGVGFTASWLSGRFCAWYNTHIFLGNPVKDFLLTFLPKIIDYGAGV